ncbi:MAG TPA: alpha/beta fold hydrolase [Tepidisphaeraceae bacterium]|nr:alpha/beta fold hydrolase [Tepidisphaeraceae bacterium]
MPSIDWPLEKLIEYKPALYREPDFDDFWKQTISAAGSQALNEAVTPYDLKAKGLKCFSVRWDGFVGGADDRPGRIAGWYVRPEGSGKYPGVMFYHGYGGRGVRPLDMVSLASQGFCVMSMDCRGQTGDSADQSAPASGHSTGYMTKGILDPATYYYRYVYADAVRALELLATRKEVDESRLAVTGGSQGGAISLAVSALTPRKLTLSLPDVPFLCDFRRAINITPQNPYPEIVRYLKLNISTFDRVIKTLSYFDNMNLAPWIKCQTVIANGLWDDVCPPSTIYAAYNHIPAAKQMCNYPYHGHETPYEHKELQFRLLTELLRAGE